MGYEVSINAKVLIRILWYYKFTSSWAVMKKYLLCCDKLLTVTGAHTCLILFK